VDSESLAAAGLLAALGRASGLLAELRHPFVRAEPFSYFFPPAGARTGVRVTLPDGRELTFEVSIAVSIGAPGGFLVGGSIVVEGETLLELPRASSTGLHDALATVEEYAAEVAEPAGRLIDGLLDEIV
jgi:hypothetical protein